jgi:cytidylate kinase
MAASVSSAIPEVRAFLLDLQRQMAEKYNIVMDGRDIATVVLPNATVKIFLTADVEVRAKRRYDEMIVKDPTVKFEDVLKDVIKRDENDSSRAVAPLKPAEDSVILNTTNYTFDESVELLYNTVISKIGG